MSSKNKQTHNFATRNSNIIWMAVAGILVATLLFQIALTAGGKLIDLTSYLINSNSTFFSEAFIEIYDWIEGLGKASILALRIIGVLVPVIYLIILGILFSLASIIFANTIRTLGYQVAMVPTILWLVAGIVLFLNIPGLTLMLLVTKLISTISLIVALLCCIYNTYLSKGGRKKYDGYRQDSTNSGGYNQYEIPDYINTHRK